MLISEDRKGAIQEVMAKVKLDSGTPKMAPMGEFMGGLAGVRGLGFRVLGFRVLGFGGSCDSEPVFVGSALWHEERFRLLRRGASCRVSGPPIWFEL